MSRAMAITALFALALVCPVAARAEEPAPEVGIVRARARLHGDTVLDLAQARLMVPEGAVAPRAVIAFGLGGIPSPLGDPGVTGVVISAAGGIRAPIALVVRPSPADRSVLVGRAPVLVDTANLTRTPCLARDDLIACSVQRPGVYVVGGAPLLDPPAATQPPEALLERALAGRVVDASGRRERPLILTATAIATAAILGTVAVLTICKGRVMMR